MREAHYRLSISPAIEAFRPEIEYACGFLDACYHVARTPDAERVLHYGPDAPAGAVAVPAALFPDGVRIDADGIYPSREKLLSIVRAKEGGLTPADHPFRPGVPFRYDPLGLIFFMLSRLEERDHPARDRYRRFPMTAALIQPEMGRLYPFADRATRDIAAALTGDENPPSRTAYSVMFTHDVDILKGYHRPIEPLWNAAGDLFKRLNPRSALKRLSNAYCSGEPWTSFRKLMALSEENGIASRFYLMGPSKDPMDSPYSVRLRDLLRRVTAEITKRGHVIGFHPGFHTATDPAEWLRQRSGLEVIIEAPVREGRQHVLRYDAAVTPRIWSDAGMVLDCTLAYPEAVGFRAGTCREFHAYDLVARCQLPLKQISTAVMEFGLFGGKYRDLSVEQAIAESNWASDICRQFGGTFVLLFHTGQAQRPLWTWIKTALAHAAP